MEKKKSIVIVWEVLILPVQKFRRWQEFSKILQKPIQPANNIPRLVWFKEQMWKSFYNFQAAAFGCQLPEAMWKAFHGWVWNLKQDSAKNKRYQPTHMFHTPPLYIQQKTEDFTKKQTVGSLGFLHILLIQIVPNWLYQHYINFSSFICVRHLRFEGLCVYDKTSNLSQALSVPKFPTFGSESHRQAKNLVCSKHLEL